MSITLHGAVYLVAAFCTLWGAASILAGIDQWVAERFTRSGWRIHRRWDRPGAWVILPDGREAVIDDVYRETRWSFGKAEAKAALPAVAPAMAVVNAYVDEEQQDPEWVPIALLVPAPKYAEVTDA